MLESWASELKKAVASLKPYIGSARLPKPGSRPSAGFSRPVAQRRPGVCEQGTKRQPHGLQYPAGRLSLRILRNMPKRRGLVCQLQYKAEYDKSDIVARYVTPDVFKAPGPLHEGEGGRFGCHRP